MTLSSSWKDQMNSAEYYRGIAKEAPKKPPTMSYLDMVEERAMNFFLKLFDDGLEDKIQERAEIGEYTLSITLPAWGFTNTEAYECFKHILNGQGFTVTTYLGAGSYVDDTPALEISWKF